MQDTWDRFRKENHVNLIVSGSVYTLMNKIFRDAIERMLQPESFRQQMMESKDLCFLHRTIIYGRWCGLSNKWL